MSEPNEPASRQEPDGEQGGPGGGRGGSRLDTRLVHAGGPDPRIRGSLVTPIFQSATYEYGLRSAPEDPGGGGRPEPDGEHPRDAGGRRLRYLRLGNAPDQEALQAKLADVSGAEDALVTASGMAAISCALLGNLRAGDHLLAADGLYGGTHELLVDALPEAGVDVDFVDADDPGSWTEALRPESRALYVETISNPLMEVPDLEAAARFAAEHGLLSMVDNTFATPVNFRPLEHGFDLSLHSATKYLNGHSDIVAGAVLGRAEPVARARRRLRQLGPSLDPHAAFLMERGLKTLGLRVRRQNDSATRLARHLQDRAGVERVHYPGLESHRRHERARRLFDGFGGMLSFELSGGLEAAEAFLGRLSIPVVAPSLGGVESLVTRPAATSHASLTREERSRLGIGDGLVRLSVGVEAVEDLAADLGAALEARP